LRLYVSVNLHELANNCANRLHLTRPLHKIRALDLW
jgi:hypothetical protein